MRASRPGGEGFWGAWSPRRVLCWRWVGRRDGHGLWVGLVILATLDAVFMVHVGLSPLAHLLGLKGEDPSDEIWPDLLWLELGTSTLPLEEIEEPDSSADSVASRVFLFRGLGLHSLFS